MARAILKAALKNKEAIHCEVIIAENVFSEGANNVTVKNIKIIMDQAVKNALDDWYVQLFQCLFIFDLFLRVWLNNSLHVIWCALLF